jgi:hypothetical protein
MRLDLEHLRVLNDAQAMVQDGTKLALHLSRMVVDRSIEREAPRGEANEKR